jgi:hypothetical protein
MATSPQKQSTESKILRSLWHGISPHLIARFYPVKKLADGSGWAQSRETRELSSTDKYVVDDGFEVHCPITDGNMETTLNWSSPFEGAGAESKAPALTAMLQSGTLTPVLQAVLDKVGASSAGSSVSGMLDKSVGRTGITKLNSTQIFTGMPPIKLSMTLHFRALVDPVAEVRDPIMQLKRWYLPQLLSNDGLLAGAIKNGAEQSTIESIFPSISPQIIGFRFGDMTMEPMVIESMSEPFTNPRSEKGVIVQQSIQLTLATLTALDRRDIEKVYR